MQGSCKGPQTPRDQCGCMESRLKCCRSLPVHLRSRLDIMEGFLEKVSLKGIGLQTERVGESWVGERQVQAERRLRWLLGAHMPGTDAPCWPGRERSSRKPGSKE